MTLHGKPLAWVTGLALCSAVSPALGATAENPYQGIVERNVFGLKPPPPPPDPESLKPPASKIILTGIITIFGKKQAMMKTPPGPAAPAKPGQPPQPAKENTYLLAEGQRQDEITVLQIDEVAKSVKVDNSGHIETLTFSTNEVKTAAAPAPGGPMPATFGAPQAPGGGFRSIPRPLRVPGMGSTSATSVGGGNSYGMANTGAVGSPAYGSPYGGGTAGVNVNGTSLNFGGAQSEPQSRNAANDLIPAVANMSPDAYGLLLETERQRTASEVQAGKLAPLPVTVYTPQGAPGTLPQDNPTGTEGSGGGTSPVRNRLPNRPGMPQLPQ